jgi:hypothetical protein
MERCLDGRGEDYDGNVLLSNRNAEVGKATVTSLSPLRNLLLATFLYLKKSDLLL